MSSNAIYHTANDRTPYTYLIGWSSLDKWYYGRRTSKGCHPNDLWVKYFTSSKYVKEFRITHGEPDIVEIRKVFNDIPSCCEWEDKVLVRLHVGFDNEKYLNKKPGSRHWNNHTATFDVSYRKGKTYVKYADTGEVFGWVSIEDPRYLTGTLVNIQTGNTYGPNYTRNKNISNAHIGKEKSEEHKKNLSDSKKGNVIAKDINTGEPVVITKEQFELNKDIYVGRTKGLIPTKDKDGNTYMVTKNDQRYVSGDLVHISTGTENVSAKGTAPAKCPITGKSLGRISTSDHRWSTGEIIHQSIGTKSNVKGSKWMKHKTFKSIQVLPEKFNEFIDAGYTFGRK